MKKNNNLKNTMKGQEVTSIIWTALVLIVVAILLCIFYIVGMVNSFVSEPSGFTVSFVKSLNDPYSVMEGVAHLKVGDRLVFEHILEANLTNLQGSSSGGVPTAIANYIKEYEKGIYIVNVPDLFSVSNIRGTTLEEIICGENAYCIDDVSIPYGGVCPVGTVGIEDTNKKCKSGQYCCLYDLKKYAENTNREKPNAKMNLGIVHCGQTGLCNPDEAVLLGETPKMLPRCGNGFVQIEDTQGDCEKANGGNTPTCCAPALSVSSEKTKITERIIVPFLYKGATLFEPKEYSCQYPTTDCLGEYVDGLCPPGQKCCITDLIHCKALNGNYKYNEYYCMDVSHCNDIGGTTVDNLCPDPEPSSYKCCKIDPPQSPPMGGLPGSAEIGKCTLIGNSYSGRNRTASIEATVGD